MKIKILLPVILTLLLTACSLDVSLNTDTESISNAADKIAEFKLPDGYYPDFTSEVMGYQVAAYTRGDGPSHIYLIQSEDAADWQKLAQALDQVVISSGDSQTELSVIETRAITVRGQETTLVISEAVNSEGLTYRQAMVGFQGNGGPALLVFSESLLNWDQNTLENLLNSIR